MLTDEQLQAIADLHERYAGLLRTTRIVLPELPGTLHTACHRDAFLLAQRVPELLTMISKLKQGLAVLEENSGYKFKDAIDVE
jgi:hypothetical protein